MVTAEYDPLCDEGEQYAKVLEEAEANVECVRYDGTVHGFMSMASTLDIGKRAIERASLTLKKELK
ncbi:alpha/beta hydrolase [Alteribacillus bidgolensis]|uniref:alpha/beta hydrolase n=1 Tax=Alteribacillus bidgolensis TaxID=930129 RepID=UPI002482EE2C|nr:alpha/beta hydrolase fold domain-containing protein [Alteribacillus bidgolensis]